MEKQQFTEAIEALRLQFDHDIKCANALAIIYPEAEHHFYKTHWLQNALVMILQEQMKDAKPNSAIEQYCWMDDFGRVPGSQFDSAEELYEYLKAQ